MQESNCGGKLELRFMNYENPGHRLRTGLCCDNNIGDDCTDECDTFFKICMDAQNGGSSCSLLDFQTAVLGNDDFDFSSSLGNGYPNPFIYSFDQWIVSINYFRYQISNYLTGGYAASYPWKGSSLVPTVVNAIALLLNYQLHQCG